MKTRINLAAWSAAFLAAASLAAACGSSVTDDGAAAGGDGGSGQGGDAASSTRASTSRASASAATTDAVTTSVTSTTSTSHTSSVSTGMTCDPPACKDPTPVIVAGQDTGFVSCSNDAVFHRAKIVACPSTLPRAGQTCDPQGTDACSQDTDCTDKANGHCEHGGGGTPFACACSYGCLEDADCGPGQICQCGDPVGACVQAGCTSDDDCDGGLLCASYDAQPGCYFEAFACQTCQDHCLDNAACGSAGGECTIQAASGERKCVPPMCAIGRPFLVDGDAVLADVVPGSAWSGEIPLLEPIDAPDVAAAHWTRTALAEHASVAAFARFALDLMALGAPADLVRDAHVAMGDEIEHARLAFALASRFGGRDVGPGPLPMTGALDGRTLASILRDVVIEGCVGETVAALEAEEAARHVRDPAVRSVLEKIARDERRHALLAYRFVAWAAEIDRDLTWRTLEDVLAAPAVASAEASALELGIVGGALRSSLRAHVVDTVLRQAAGAYAHAIAA